MKNIHQTEWSQSTLDTVWTMYGTKSVHKFTDKRGEKQNKTLVLRGERGTFQVGMVYQDSPFFFFLRVTLPQDTTN